MVLGPIQSKFGWRFTQAPLAGKVGVETRVCVRVSTSTAKGPNGFALPARSVAVKITWSVAAQGAAPAHTYERVEFTSAKPETVSAWTAPVPSKPVSVALTGVIAYTLPASAATRFPLKGTRAESAPPVGLMG